MKKQKAQSEKLFLNHLREASNRALLASKGLGIGALLRLIRKQLGMSQAAVAKRARVPQATLSRLETSKVDITLSTLEKVLGALSAELVLIPYLRESVDEIRKKQAHKRALEQISYLIGTMNLEKQKPDPKFLKMLLEQEEKKLLDGPDKNLWG